MDSFHLTQGNPFCYVLLSTWLSVLAKFHHLLLLPRQFCSSPLIHLYDAFCDACDDGVASRKKLSAACCCLCLLYDQQLVFDAFKRKGWIDHRKAEMMMVIQCEFNAKIVIELHTFLHFLHIQILFFKQYNSTWEKEILILVKFTNSATRWKLRKRCKKCNAKAKEKLSTAQDRWKRILGMRLPWALVMRHRLVF